MKQKIMDDCLAILILLTFLVGLYWLGGGAGETALDSPYPDSKVLQGVDEFH